MRLSHPRLVLFSAIATGIATLTALTLNPRPVAASYGGSSGVVRIHQMGGDINVEHAPEGAELATMGGSIHVGNASFVKASTMGGDIEVDRASGSVNASTMGGKVEIKQASGGIHAATMSGDVRAHLTGASAMPREVKLSSMSGSILLTVPKDFGMDVHIKLAYTQNSSQSYRIIQHLGLAEHESADWDTHGGTPRKYIVATGRVGDGKNKVTIDTINGDVVLKQE
jgi:DUF4097 and DUF4098 domain-containing protein YvlB